MTKAKVALSLGSNLGDRVAHLTEAINRLRAEPHFAVAAVSPVAETSPVGGPPQPDFLNLVVVAYTTKTPDAVLSLARACEQHAERVRSVRWGPRTLDVDVLAYDQLALATPELTVPHPRAVERAFVMLPWKLVDPDFEISGHPVRYWADRLDGRGVSFIGELESV